MNPAFSVVIFTTVAGAAQGLMVALALAALGAQAFGAQAIGSGFALAPGFVMAALVVAFVMLLVGLGASFLHLGRPERAWRAATMWRTSWLSREVIVLPAFIGLVALWWLGLYLGWPTSLTGLVIPLAAIAVAALLWYCTAMIYACLPFIEEWAHGFTLVNFVLLGLSSGWLLAAAFGAIGGEAGFVRVVGPAALVVTLLAWLCRMLALRRNAGIRHRTTLQSATGIDSPRLKQASMGMSAGSFNTREFFHKASRAAVQQVKLALVVLGFALPTVLVLWGIVSGSLLPYVLAVIVQAPGLVCDRWFFFAQAKHPQNLYYQVVS